MLLSSPAGPSFNSNPPARILETGSLLIWSTQIHPLPGVQSRLEMGEGWTWGSTKKISFLMVDWVSYLTNSTELLLCVIAGLRTRNQEWWETKILLLWSFPSSGGDGKWETELSHQVVRWRVGLFGSQLPLQPVHGHFSGAKCCFWDWLAPQ